MNKLAREYGPKGLVIVAPSLDAEVHVLKFRNATKAEYPMLTDAQKLADRYLVNGYPFAYLIGKDGKVLWRDNRPNSEMMKLLETALASEAPSQHKAPASVYVLKDGRRISVVTKMEAGGKILLRDDKGKMITVSADDIKEVLTGDQAAGAAESGTKTDAAVADPGTAEVRKTDPTPPEAKPQEPEAKTGEAKSEPSKYPVLVLRDGRRIPMTMKMEAGAELMVKDDVGKMHTIKKADVVETIPAGPNR